jgi:hypothetical protein
MPDASAHEISVERLPVDVAMSDREPGEVQVKSTCPAVAHLHRREVPPALMLEQGERLVVGVLAVDLYVSCLSLHRPQRVMAGPARSAATIALDEGVALAVVQEMLGHSDLVRGPRPVFTAAD